MIYQLSAACGCSIGRIRDNNEDNFYFNGRSLNERNKGLGSAVSLKCRLETEACFGVFDGMGGEESGEIASYTAALALKSEVDKLRDFACAPREFLQSACGTMNDAVCAESGKLSGGRMGTTAAMLFFVPDEVYICNIGDSRVYRLRDNELLQISMDHVEKLPPNSGRKKPRLSQHLGIFRDELTIEPYIAKGDIQKDDIYLICSDGLTDMLTNIEICTCLKEHISVKRMANHLIKKAIHNGGRDNVTAMIIKVL